MATLPTRCLARFTLSHVSERLPTLSHALPPQTLNIPEIVAIGGQSDGKSSLLEAFLGVRRRLSGRQAAPSCDAAGSTRQRGTHVATLRCCTAASMCHIPVRPPAPAVPLQHHVLGDGHAPAADRADGARPLGAGAALPPAGRGQRRVRAGAWLQQGWGALAGGTQYSAAAGCRANIKTLLRSPLHFSPGALRTGGLLHPLRRRSSPRPPLPRRFGSAPRCTCASWEPPSAARCACGRAAGGGQGCGLGYCCRLPPCLRTNSLLHPFPCIRAAAHRDACRVCICAQPDHSGHARLHPQGTRGWELGGPSWL